MWWPALAAGSLWLVMGLSAGFWLLRWWGASPVTPLPATPLPPVFASAQSVARALGEQPAVAADQAPAPMVTAARFRLLGVLAQGGAGGVALIAMDSQPPRPYVVGAVVTDGLVLQSVGRKTARLGASSALTDSFELSLPAVPSQAP